MCHPACCCVSLGPCDRCNLLVDGKGFHLVAVARRECALVLDRESCDRCALPGLWVIARGHGRVVVEVIDAPRGSVPVRIRWHNTTLDMPRNQLPDGDIPGAQREGVRTPGASGCAGDPLGDPTVARRGSHHCRIGSTTGNHVEYRAVPYQAEPARPHLMTPPASQACGYPGPMRGVWHHHDRRRGSRAHRHREPDSREGLSHGSIKWTLSWEGLASCTRTGWPSAEKTCAREA